MALSPSQAQLVLDAHINNLAKKVANGGTLSDKELSQVLAARDGGAAVNKTHAENQVELAEALNVDRKTIQRWLKIDGNPGRSSNGKYELLAWRAYAASRGHDIPDDLDQTQLRAENLLLLNERLKIAIAREREEVIPTVMAQQIFGGLVMSAKARSFSAITRLATLARIAPDMTAATEEIRKEITSIWKALEDSKWFKDEDSDQPR